MRRFFGAIWRALTNRWFLTILILLMIAALIWFVGPLVSIGDYVPLESETVRIVVIAVIVLIWLLNLLRIWYRDKKNNDKMVEAIAEAPEPEDEGAEEGRASAEEIAVLKERLQESLKTLKRAKLGGKGGRKYLYQLPWYLLIGPPGAGKTTALRNSGLNFPLTDQIGRDSIQGVGGTRNCDWWFTEEAVLLDTAGRYTTQDSNRAVDATAWTGFLGLLKRYRRRQPVNGVFVAISLPELMRQRPEERSLHARSIRQRLQEVYTELKVPVPVYVWLTKCDLAAGFVEFFDDLGREAREQVWGITFKLDEVRKPRGVLDAFESEYDLLMGRVEERELDRLDHERDVARRGMIQGFPVQMRLLRPMLKDFLTETFEPSRYQERMLLRGVYFTSGTQEGTPIDRLMSSLAQTFGLGRQALPTFSGAGRSYFITKLLRDVIFAESGLGAGTTFVDRFRTWILRGAVALAVLVVLVGGLAWWNSYRLNQEYIAAVEAEVEAYNAESSVLSEDIAALQPILPVLQRLRSIPGGYDERDEAVPLTMRLGLYQGEKLGSAAIVAYKRVLNKALLPRMIYRLEQQMRDNLDRPEFLYESLKTYLMLEDPTRFDADAVTLWYTVDREAWLPGPANQSNREQLDGHLAALLDTPLEPPAPDIALVERAREVLTEASEAERAYSRLKQEYQNSSEFKDWRLSEVLGSSANRVFVRESGKPLTEGVPGLYTADAYKSLFPAQALRIVKEVGDERWVIGVEAADQNAPDAGEYFDLQLDVTGLYLEDYARHWDAILDDVRIVPFDSLRHAVDVLQELSGVNSVLRRFFEKFTEQTTLARQGPDLQAAARVSSRLTTLSYRLERLLRIAPKESLEELAADPGLVIDRRYAPIHELVKAKEGERPRIEEVMTALDELQLHINSLANAPNRGDAALRATAEPGSRGAAVIDRLTLEATRQPAPLRDFLQTLATRGAGLSLIEVKGSLNAKWQNNVAQFCRQALSDRYPFVRKSPNDVNLADFTRLFAPGGMLERFFQENLASLVDTSTRPWSVRSVAGADAGISASALSAFERADQIRRVFFQGGSAPGMAFDLKPESLDSSVSQFLLEVDGQKITYRHGPARSERLTWPGSDGFGIARIVFTGFDGSSETAGADGPWAFFRLLERSRMEPTQQRDQFRVSFEAGGHIAVYQMKATSVANPFRLPALERFRCPGSL